MEQEQEGRLGRPAVARRGRARPGTLLLLPAVLLCAYAAAWRLRASAPAGGEGELSSAASHAGPGAVGGYAGARDLAGGGRISARLLPLQAVAAWEEFDAAALARRLDLPAGEPWRLELRHEPGPVPGAALALDGLAVADTAGAALAPPAAPRSAPPGDAPSDPLRVLFLHPAGELPPGTELQVFLWGRAPGAEARLVLGGAAELAVELLPVSVPSGELLRHIARVDASSAAAGDAR